MFMSSRPTEQWRQLPGEPDLWQGDHGVLINTAALREREAFFEVTRVAAVGSSPNDASLNEATETLQF